MKNIARQIAEAMANSLQTFALLAGAWSISYGVWAINRPAGFITAGVLLIAGTLLHARGGG